MIDFIRELFCLGHEWEEKYCEIEGFADLHYWYKCKHCGKDRVQ